MSSSELQEILCNYFYTHPGTEIEDITEMAAIAKEQADGEIIPTYKPRKIEDLNAVPDEYDVERKSPEKKVYEDESTFNAGGYE